jgi:hypothetical protein
MRAVKAGDLVKVTNGAHYALPAGLRDGDMVKLISFDHGYWTTEKEGHEYRVFLCRLDPGWEYEMGGKWVQEADWRVAALRGAVICRGDMQGSGGSVTLNS